MGYKSKKESTTCVYVGGACDGDEERRDFLVVPLMFEWIAQGGIKEPRERWRGLYLAIAPAGLIVYMGYLWSNFGDPLLF